MGRHRSPRRPRSVAPAIGGSAGILGVAALVAALDTVVVPVADTAAAARSDVTAVASEAPWVAGPLELPGIGVAAPNFEAAYAALAATPADETSAATTSTPPTAPEGDRSGLSRAPEQPEDTPALAARPTPDVPVPTLPPPSPAPEDEEETPDTATRPTPSQPPPPPEETPVEEPPVEEAPGQEPSVQERPVAEGPAEEPPVEESPAEGPPVDEPPAEEPPAEEPRGQEPPAKEPPVEEPPAEEPPADVDLPLGGQLQVTDPGTGALVATVVVEEIVVDVVCTAEGATAAQNGHLVGVRVRMTTGASVPEDLRLGAASFAVADSAGAPAGPAATAAGDACLTDAEAFPAGPLAAGTAHAGVVVLDVPTTTGTVTYRPDPDVAGGRWRF